MLQRHLQPAGSNNGAAPPLTPRVQTTRVKTPRTLLGDVGRRYAASVLQQSGGRFSTEVALFTVDGESDGKPIKVRMC